MTKFEKTIYILITFLFILVITMGGLIFYLNKQVTMLKARPSNVLQSTNDVKVVQDNNNNIVKEALELFENTQELFNDQTKYKGDGFFTTMKETKEKLQKIKSTLKDDDQEQQVRSVFQNAFHKNTLSLEEKNYVENILKLLTTKKEIYQKSISTGTKLDSGPLVTLKNEIDNIRNILKSMSYLMQILDLQHMNTEGFTPELKEQLNTALKNNNSAFKGVRKFYQKISRDNRKLLGIS